MNASDTANDAAVQYLKATRQHEQVEAEFFDSISRLDRARKRYEACLTPPQGTKKVPKKLSS